MNKSLVRIAQRLLNSAPRKVASAIVGRAPRFVAYLDDRDISLTIRNCYYGGASFVLSTKYRIERSLLYSHEYDERTLLYILRLVSAGHVCIDVGANIGSIALSMAHRVGPTGRVAAFEPGPLLYRRLERNVELSRLAQVELYHLGLGNSRDVLYWHMEEGENAGNAFLSRQYSPTEITIERLDDIPAVRAFQRVDFIKVDVEGMELSVIKGALDIIRRFRPILVIETRSGEGQLTNDTVELLTLLSTEGYEFWETDPPKDQLRPCSKDFQFVPCQYPLMPQNTLCVHRSRRELLSVSDGIERLTTTEGLSSTPASASR